MNMITIVSPLQQCENGERPIFELKKFRSSGDLDVFSDVQLRLPHSVKRFVHHFGLLLMPLIRMCLTRLMHVCGNLTD